MTPEESQFILKNIDQLILNTNLKSGTLLTLLLQTELTEAEKQSIESNVLTEYQQCYEFYKVMRMKKKGFSSLMTMTVFEETKHTQAFDILNRFVPPGNATSLPPQLQKIPTLSNTTQTDMPALNSMSTQTNGNRQSVTSINKSTQTDVTMEMMSNLLMGSKEASHSKPESQLPEISKNLAKNVVLDNCENAGSENPSVKTEVKWKHSFDRIEKVHSFECPSKVRCFQFDKTKLISVHYDDKVRIWDMATFQCTKTLDSHDKSYLYSVQYNDKFIASAGVGKILVWDITTHKLTCKFEKEHRIVFTNLKFVKNKLVPLDYFGKLLLFMDIASGDINVEAETQAHDGISYALDADGEFVITGGYDDKTVKVWKFGTLKLVRILIVHGSYVYPVIYSNRIVVIGDRQSIRLWNLDTGECLKVLTLQEYTCFAFDGIRIFSGNRKGKILIRELSEILNGDSFNSYPYKTVSVNDAFVTRICLEGDLMMVSAGATFNYFKFVKDSKAVSQT